MRFWKPRTVATGTKVGVAVAAYIPGGETREAASLACLVASLQSQTHPQWQAGVVHDGPYPHDPATLRFIDQWDRDARITVVETAERKQKFGHPHRAETIDHLLRVGCDWLLLTNQDNYYAPVFFEWMLSEAQTKKAKIVYCDCVHSHKQWAHLPAATRRGKIDLGSFLFHKDLAAKIKFDKTTFAADWDFFSRLLDAAGGKAAKVNATLFVHN